MNLKSKTIGIGAYSFKWRKTASLFLVVMLALATSFTNISAEKAYAAVNTDISTSDILTGLAYCKENPVSLSVDGNLISTDVPPVIVNSRTLIPARAVFESIGADVHWNKYEEKVEISMGDSEVVLSINSSEATVNGNAISLDVPALIIENRTVIPVRYVAESLDFDVNWEHTSRTVEIGSSSLSNGSTIQAPVTETSAPTSPAPMPSPAPTPAPAPAPAPAPEPTDPTPIAASAFYVSAAGNDSNSGTAAAPFRTIQKAADLATAGNTVYIRGGTYREEIIIKHSGVSGNVITFTNYPGETVVVDGTGFGYSSWGYSLIDLNGQDYVKINGLNVQNSIYWGIGSCYGFSDRSYNGGSNYVTVSNCTTTKTGSSGIIFHSGTGLVITGNKISHSNSTGDQEALTLCTSTNFDISGNEITASDKIYGEGIDCKQGCKNGNIYDNYIHDMPNMGIYIDAAGLATTGINIYNNTMTNLGDGVRLCNEWANSADFGYINIYGNKITNCDRGLNIENGEGNYPIHHITFQDNVLSNIADAAVRCLLPTNLYTNCLFD